MKPLDLCGNFPAMKVIKIGGGCLKNGSAAKAITDLILDRGKGDIFVLSAFYGVTDILLQGIDTALEDESHIQDVMEQIRTLHRGVIRELVEDGGCTSRLHRILEDMYAKLERYYFGISFTREATSRMRDMVATFGERISAVIMSSAVSSRGCASAHVLPEDFGIVSDGRFSDASALMDQTFTNIQEWLKQNHSPGQVLFVPGFYGISETGEITTFGRGI